MKICIKKRLLGKVISSTEISLPDIKIDFTVNASVDPAQIVRSVESRERGE